MRVSTLVLIVVFIALFFLLWVAPVLKRAIAQPFGIPFWALSFPLAAFTTLTLRLHGLQGGAGGLLQTAAVLLLAATSMVEPPGEMTCHRQRSPDLVHPSKAMFPWVSCPPA